MLAIAALVLVAPGCWKRGGAGDSAVIRGYVYEDATGEPVANALVVITPLEASVRTGADGSFRFDNLPRGKYNLRASAQGFEDAELSRVDAELGKVKWAKLFLKKPRPDQEE
jgi:iron complex outermembrane receptor protein